MIHSLELDSGLGPMITPRKFNSSPLKSERDLKGKDRLFNHPFSGGELLNFKGGVYIKQLSVEAGVLFYDNGPYLYIWRPGLALRSLRC